MRKEVLTMIHAFGILLLGVALFGCATGQPDVFKQFGPAAVSDHQVARPVHKEFTTILAVTEHQGQADSYTFFMIRDLKGKGIAGMSLGEAVPHYRHVILLDYELAQKGVDGGPDSFDRWYLRKVLAHEIGHEVAGHVARGGTVSNVLQGVNIVGRGMSYAPGVIGLIGSVMGLASAGASYANVYLYGREAELEADRKAMEYWKKLSWPCGFWVRYFEALDENKIKGDFRHPTEGRLEQAREFCPPDEVAEALPITLQRPIPEKLEPQQVPTGRPPGW